MFLLASPEAELTKLSKAKNRPPEYSEPTRYAGEHSRVFGRLGLDLLRVTDDGAAIVHATPDRLTQLAQTSAELPRAGAREQARWATIRGFSPVPAEFRVDFGWVEKLPRKQHSDIIVELQPLLSSLESEEVMQAVLALMRRDENEALVGAGTDFSGRRWFRGRASRRSVVAIAEQLFSVEAVHPPLALQVAVGGRGGGHVAGAMTPTPTPDQLLELPVVAVVDCGVPANHVRLAPYFRGQYLDPSCRGVKGDHGSLVASRVVFGDPDLTEVTSGVPRHGDCRFLDVVVSEHEKALDSKRVLPAVEASLGAYPDVRVFNFSFGSRDPLPADDSVQHREMLVEMRDLDNLIFAHDIIVVVAAGNVAEGVVPTPPYPGHSVDPNWGLGGWAMGFNTLTCGSMVGKAAPEGLAAHVDWPSPFTRVGPGLCRSPVPEFGADGGDCTAEHKHQPGLGVWGCAANGLWEDHFGTSFAAPLLAREAATALKSLQGVCVPGARPFGVTVKAFLALTAIEADYPPQIRALAERTIGRGRASAARLPQPQRTSALFVWQGVLDNAKDIARVMLPIPRTWLSRASKPRLRLIWAWDPPVHDAVLDIWACRRVNAYVKPPHSGRSLFPMGRGAHKSYPLVERSYDLSTEHLADKGIELTDDIWVVELSYEEIAEYFPAMTFTPQQRVAFVAELRDLDGVSPQAALQVMPVTQTMLRLGVPRARLAVPFAIRVRT